MEARCLIVNKKMSLILYILYFFLYVASCCSEVLISALNILYCLSQPCCPDHLKDAVRFQKRTFSASSLTSTQMLPSEMHLCLEDLLNSKAPLLLLKLKVPLTKGSCKVTFNFFSLVQLTDKIKLTFSKNMVLSEQCR